jgi:hypothetical protein
MVGIVNALIGSLVPAPGDFQSIATVNIGAGGSASVSFTSIPAEYSHLQIRGIGRQGTTTANGPSLYYNNVSSGTSYAYHNLYGTGSNNGFANAATSQPYDSSSSVIGNSTTYTSFIINILDYSNTNKNKTTRALTGYAAGASSGMYLHSNVYMSTDAINRIDIYNGYVWQQYSSFALYGIK